MALHQRARREEQRKRWIWPSWHDTSSAEAALVQLSAPEHDGVRVEARTDAPGFQIFPSRCLLLSPRKSQTLLRAESNCRIEKGGRDRLAPRPPTECSVA